MATGNPLLQKSNGGFQRLLTAMICFKGVRRHTTLSTLGKHSLDVFSVRRVQRHKGAWLWGWQAEKGREPTIWLSADALGALPSVPLRSGLFIIRGWLFRLASLSKLRNERNIQWMFRGPQLAIQVGSVVETVGAKIPTFFVSGKIFFKEKVQYAYCQIFIFLESLLSITDLLEFLKCEK